MPSRTNPHLTTSARADIRHLYIVGKWLHSEGFSFEGRKSSIFKLALEGLAGMILRHEDEPMPGLQESILGLESFGIVFEARKNERLEQFNDLASQLDLPMNEPLTDASLDEAFEEVLKLRDEQGGLE